MAYSNRLIGGYFLAVAFCSLSMSCGGGSVSAPQGDINVTDADILFVVDPNASSAALESRTKSQSEDLGPLRKIKTDGSIEPAIFEIVDGENTLVQAPPAKIFKGPDGKAYVFLGGQLPLTINDELCRLIRIDSARNVECVGPSDGVEVYYNNATRPEECFDGDNNFYYLGCDNCGAGAEIDIPDTLVIARLAPSGEITTLVEYLYDNTTRVDSFLVASDGSLLFNGRTSSIQEVFYNEGGTPFFRRALPDGSIQELDLPCSGLLTDEYGQPALRLNINAILAPSGDIFAMGYTMGYNSDGYETAFLALCHGTPEGTGFRYDPLINMNPSASLQAALIDGTGANANGINLFYDEEGNIYEFAGSIRRVFPGDVIDVSAQNHSVSRVLMNGNVLYYSSDSRLGDTTQAFLERVDLKDPSLTNVTLLEGFDVNDFELRSNANVVFSGKRLSDNQYVVGEISASSLELSIKASSVDPIVDVAIVE